MKKVLAVFLVMLMVLSMSVSVFAAPGSFVSSPSGNPVPGIVNFNPRNDACTAQLIITAYADRHMLPDALRALIEQAYKNITDTKDLTSLNADLAKIAKNKNIDTTKLAVSDLFDLHLTGCDYHEGHTYFDITLEADTLDRFVALLHMNKNGEWELVADAQAENNGDHLTFSVEGFSPFAIVVDTSVDVEDDPETGDNSMIQVYATIMVISALAVVVILVKGKKQKLF